MSDLINVATSDILFGKGHLLKANDKKKKKKKKRNKSEITTSPNINTHKYEVYTAEGAKLRTHHDTCCVKWPGRVPACIIP